MLKFYFALLAVGEGQSGNHPGSNTRMTPIGRLMTPRSQAGNAFESIADSDEEGTEFANEDDDTFNYGNVDSLDNTVTVRVSVILAYHSYALCLSENDHCPLFSFFFFFFPVSLPK